MLWKDHAVGDVVNSICVFGSAVFLFLLSSPLKLFHPRLSIWYRVVVIASTNRPFDLDEAVLRRLPRRIMVDLPDLNTRREILQVTLAGELPVRDWVTELCAVTCLCSCILCA